MATLDGLIKQVGSCGPFQTLLTVAVHATFACSVWGMLFMAFGGYNPGWVCGDHVGRLPWENASTLDANGRHGPNSSRLLPINSTHGYNTSTDLWSSSNEMGKCQEFSKCTNVSFLPGSSTIVTEWNLVCDKHWVPSIIFTVQMVGVLLGAYVAGHLGDCVGRRAALYGMVALHALTNLAAVFSPSWQTFAAVRFFIGVAVGGILTTFATIPIEFLGQFWRGVAGSLPTWNIGAALFSIAVLLLKDWRHVHLLTAALSALAFLPVFWMPESLRWLAVHGRDVTAMNVANKIAGLNKRQRPTVELIQEVTESERNKAQAEDSRHFSYIDLFRDRKVCKITVIMGFVWISMAFIYYAIGFNVHALSGDFYINFLIFSVMEVPGMLFVLLALSFLGRRKGTVIHFLFVSLNCFAVIPVVFLLKSDRDDQGSDDGEMLKGKLIMALSLLAKLGTICAWNIITVFCGELFPTVVRNLGFGFLNAAARIGGMLGPVLFPCDPDLLPVVMAGMGVIALVCMGLILALPETKGASLKDLLPSKCLPETILVANTDINGFSEYNALHENEEVDNKSKDSLMHVNMHNTSLEYTSTRSNSKTEQSRL